MKKSLFFIAAVILLFLGTLLDISTGSVPVERVNANDPNDYEFHLSRDVLLSHKLIGLEQTPYRSIEFKELKNGNIEMTLLFDVSSSDSLVEEYIANGVKIPEPETIVYELNELIQESDTSIHLANEQEGVSFVFFSDSSGFIYDQIGYDYMIVQK